jgi:hypothetical protein
MMAYTFEEKTKRDGWRKAYIMESILAEVLPDGVRIMDLFFDIDPATGTHKYRVYFKNAEGHPVHTEAWVEHAAYIGEAEATKQLIEVLKGNILVLY